MNSSCRGNLGPCGGGGLLRDDNGRLQTIFSKKQADGTNNGLEFQALIRGVQLCKILAFEQIAIEVSDSKLVVGWARKKHCKS